MPATTGALFALALNITDTFVAGFWSTDAQAALGFSFPLFYVILAFSVGLTRSGTGLVSRALGEKDQAGARHLAVQLLLSSVAAGLLVTAAGIPLAAPLAEFLGALDGQAEMTVEYITWIYAFAPLFIATMALSGVLSAHGNTRTYRNALGAGVLLNCALDPILMFGWLGLPALGLLGIAVATVLVQAVMFVWLLAVAVQSGALGKGWARLLVPSGRTQRAIAAQAAPPTLNMLSINFGFFVYTFYLGHLDAKAVAAFGIANRIDQLVQMLASGFSLALLAIAGQNFGARMFDRVRKTLALADKHALMVTMAGGVFLLAAGQGLVWLFNREEEIISYGYSYLVAAAFIGPVHALLHNCVSMLQAVGKPAMIVPLSVARMVVLPPLFCWLFVTVAGLGVNGVWLSLLLANLLVMVLARAYTTALLGKVAPVPG